jgi:hypothetical protein
MCDAFGEQSQCVARFASGGAAADVLRGFRQSDRRMLKTVTALSEAGLFTPGRYAWTRKNTPDAYFVSATSSHYHWARKEIRKCLKD